MSPAAGSLFVTVRSWEESLQRVHFSLQACNFSGLPCVAATGTDSFALGAIGVMTGDSGEFSTMQARQSLNRAMAFHTEGDLDKAEEYYLEVLRHRYRTLDILPLLAGIAALKGDFHGAIAYWTEMLRTKSDHLVGLMEKGALLLKVRKADDAVQCFKAARRLSPDSVLVLNNLAVALADAGQRDEALMVFRELAHIQPDDPNYQHQIRRMSSAIVPFWHIPMLNDVSRNDAFEKAITKAIEQRGSQARVLDIGTGSGLLSMMAVRAGARNVVTCEAVPVIAETAKRIVAANDLENRIKVVNKVSTELLIGEDLDQRANILVSEILSSDLLAENVLSTFEDAHLRLLQEDATIIPRAATAIGCLVESETLAKYCFVGNASGFDVSQFTALASNRLPVHGTMTAWRRLSPDIRLQTLDLTANSHEPELRTLSIPVSEDGVAVGIIQWIHVDLIEGVEFSNHPDDYFDGGWLQVLHPFPQLMPVSAGSSLDILVGHDRTSLILLPAKDRHAHASGVPEAVQ